MGASGTSEGVAFADYFYFDPSPHESVSLQLEMLQSGGSNSGWVDVFLSFGTWPTPTVHDAAMIANTVSSRTAQFVLSADRLFNERVFVLVVGRGESWSKYEVSVDSTASVKTLAALSVAVVILVGALVSAAWLVYTRRLRQNMNEDSLVTEARKRSPPAQESQFFGRHSTV